MSDTKLAARVDRLLHDAEHKDAGAVMAARFRDEESVRRLIAGRDALVAKALELDPQRACPAWKECDPIIARLTPSPLPSEAPK